MPTPSIMVIVRNKIWEMEPTQTITSTPSPIFRLNRNHQPTITATHLQEYPKKDSNNSKATRIGEMGLPQDTKKDKKGNFLQRMFGKKNKNKDNDY